MNANTLMQKAGGLLLCVAMLAILTGCLPYTTGSEEVAVITKKGILNKKGVQPEIQQRGTTKFLVPFLNDWHTFNVSLQKLEMTATRGRGDRQGADDLPFKTIDGNDVSLDLIITYVVNPDMTPYILQHVATTDEELKENIIRTIARSVPRDIFGELMTEEFYIASDRSAKAEEVRLRMSEILEPFGVRVSSVETQDYRFNPAYQKAIEDKKVADQQVEKNRAAAKAAEEEFIRKVEEARGDVAQMKAQADGELKRAQIEADAYYIQQERLAQAIEVEGRTEAEAILKMNEALAGAGGEVMVKLAIAEAMQGKRILLIPIGGGGLDVRTTDINALLQLYGIQKVSGQR